MFYIVHEQVVINFDNTNRLTVLQIHDEKVVDAIEATIENEWKERGGMNRVKKKHQWPHEIELNGTPWWASGKLLIVILHCNHLRYIN